jgi:Ni/Fe-hydrogenase 1 B-type cytochrome subunit
MKAIRVWEFPIRLIHWTNFLAIVVLCITGTYIHWPFLTPNIPLSWTLGYGVMGLTRLIHLVCGWALLCGLVARFVWAPLFGNRHCALKEFFPWATAKGRQDLVGVLKYYTFFAKRLPHCVGHNALASMSYFFVFCLMAFQVVTGFALWSQMDPAGTAYALTGWVFGLASNGYVRFAHHSVMFAFTLFAMVHLYAMWIADLGEKNGSAGSIFGGYKYCDRED